MAHSDITMDKRKKRTFYVLLVLTPFLILLLVELVLRLFQYGGNLDLFITGPEQQISQYWMCNPNIGERYFYRQNTKPSPPKDLFLKEKPENGYRIFAMGGSTTAGFPYGYNVMFPRILNVRLTDLFPDRHIEVVNTGMSAVNSYTLYDLTDEILEHEPDALLIYAGHNEFYGAMGVGSQETLGKNPAVIYSYLKLYKFKLFLLVRDIVGKFQKSISELRTGGTKADPTATLMARIVGEQSIPYQSEMYQRGVAQYEQNLRRILEKARAQGVPVVLSELVSNIKDQAPFVSVQADTFPTADRAYSIGRKLLQQGDDAKAREALTLAKDLDALRFRATDDMNEIIHRLGDEYSVPVAPLKSIYNAESENEIIGNELILEHLHPNIRGYFLMADGFLQTMKNEAFIGKQWPETRQTVDEVMADWGLTKLDTAAANLSIKYLKGSWPFQPAGTPNYTLDNYVMDSRVDTIAYRILVDQGYSSTVGHFDLARFYENTGHPEKAYREYKAALYSIPSEMEFYKGAASNLIRLREFDKALDIIERSEMYGSTPTLKKWAGQILVQQQNYHAALPYLRDAHDAFPQDNEAARLLLGALSETGDLAAAQKLADELDLPAAIDSENRPPRPKLPDPEQQADVLHVALMQKARELIGNKEYSKALPVLLKAHEFKETYFTSKWVGLLSLQNGKLDQGVEYLEKAVEFEPQDFESYYNLCNAYIHLGREQDARRILKALERLRPDFNDPQNLRSRTAEM